MRDTRSNLSIKRTMILVFMTAMVISMGSVGHLVFSSWVSSARQTTESIAGKMNENIYDQIYSFLRVPEQINEFNYKIIANGVLDLSNEKKREKFFAGELRSYKDEIYSFSYGTANGEYYGARRNEDGAIEIIKNNAATAGSNWYYSVKDDLTAGELLIQAGEFDPRTRAWYKAAVAADTPTFSPIYKHFVMDDVTISHACPVYNEGGTLQGVLSTHVLLTNMGACLEDAVSKFNGYAVILEESSNHLIANSMGIDNVAILPDGTLERYGIGKIADTDIREAYAQYKTNLDPNFFYKGKDRNLYINVKEIHMTGLDWVVVSAIPEGYLMTPAVQSIRLAAILSALSLLLSCMIYTVITRRLLRPMDSLLQTAEALSAGDLTKRIDIVRRDEVGQISESFNKVADKMQFFVNNLELTVKERTEELRKANTTLEENKNQLQLILDSAAEAIYGIDVQGNCTFCNRSCIELLGYHDQAELLGKNMHWQIHHTRKDGTPFPLDECRIFKAFLKGEGSHVVDEVFHRADGTPLEVEYYSYPQVRNGEIMGAVVTFMDISDRRQKEAEIQYLSYHDVLTGLNNRRYFEETRRKIDIPERLPLSVVFADINGLKMTNDVFGHAAGDKLIKKSAEILQKVCRQNDVVARVGGDEFILLLPNTTREEAETVLARIQAELTDARVETVKCSISLGLETKRSPSQPLDEIITSAENAMYKEKALRRESINKDIIDTIMETLHSRHPREKEHSLHVSELCSAMGVALQLSETEIRKLNRAGYLHDIGKIVLDETLLANDSADEDGLELMRHHAAVGYRILNLFDDTLDLAEYVYSHHERWDGTGYPRGLKGAQIPLLSRIISVAQTYDRVLQRGELPLKERRLAAMEAIKQGAGTQFDPKIAELFVQIIENGEGA